MARTGRLDILWSVNKLARSITKWTKACDKRLNRLISYIHHTCEYKQHCHVGNTAKQCRLGLFQESDFAGDLEDSKSTSGGTLCVFGSHTFVPISWMCKKQTAVSHSSTESEIISLDTGLRLDGLPALEQWDLIFSVLENISRVSDRTGKPVNGENKHHKSHNKIDVTRDIDAVPSNVQSARQEALLYVFEDNEAVIKMVMKGRSPTMRHVSRTHRVALDWLFDRINLDPKIQIKYIDTKNQLADILTKGNFTRDEWNHLLTLFTISHFSSTTCIAAMAKRAQQESGEERVTAKSRSMMNLTARTPSFVSSSASSNLERTSYGCQDPGRSVASDDGTGKLVQPSRPDYTQEDYGRSWSSQEWKNGAAEHDRSGKPEEISWNTLQKVDPHREEPLLGRNAHSARYGELIHDGSGKPETVNHQEQAYSEIFVMGSDAAGFVNKVKDQVRNRQKKMSNVAESGEEHSIIWGMFVATTLNAATLMGKNFSTIPSVVKNHEDLTLKQMFDVTAQLVNNQEEINCLDKILWGKNSWTRLSLIDDEIVINLQRTKVYVFSDSVLCLGKVLQHPESNEAWKNRVAGIRSEKSYRDYDAINGESTEFEWNIFPGFTTLQLCDKISDLLSYLGQTPATFTGRIQHMSMFNDISCDRTDNKDECLKKCRICEDLREDLVSGNAHLLDQVLKRSGILPRTVHKEPGTTLRNRCCWNLQKVDILFSVQRLHCPGVVSRAKDVENCRYTSLHMWTQLIQFIALFFLSISSAVCDEFESHQDRTGEPVILMGQSIVLGEVKAETPLHNPMNDQIIWQQYIQQVESLSPENKVSKFCKEAGFMRGIEVGQYFVTKDTGSLTQFRSVACREYTLPRDDPASQAKGWIQGNMRVGPVLEVTTSFQHFKYGIEIRIWSVSQDNSHSWVRISYGTVKYVIDSIQDNIEIPADPQEEQVPQTSIKVGAARSKAKAKPQPRVLVGTTATVPIHERRWIDIEPSEQNLASYDLSKKVINLLRHNQTLQREHDGAIEFYKIKFHLRNHHSQIQVWSDDRWKACLAAGGGSKRRYQYCSDDSGTILYLRALQGHSGSNLIDPTLQDNVVIGTGIFNYVYHVGCTFNLHSIINNGLVSGGQNLSRRQTVFFLPVDPRGESHRDPEYIDFSVPRLARYMHSAWKRHQDSVFWVDIDLAIREGLTFYQTRSNAINHSSRNTSSLLHSKS